MQQYIVVKCLLVADQFLKQFPTTTPDHTDQTAGRSCEQKPCARVTLQLPAHVQEEGVRVGTSVARAPGVVPNTSTDPRLWAHRAFCHCFTPSQKSECAFPTILFSTSSSSSCSWSSHQYRHNAALAPSVGSYTAGHVDDLKKKSVMHKQREH